MKPRLLQLVGAVAGTVAALSAAAAAWRCYRGRHPRTGRRLEFCPWCHRSMNPGRWRRLVGGSYRKGEGTSTGAIH